MVDIRPEREENTRIVGRVKSPHPDGMISTSVSFNKELFVDILAEARRRKWPFSRMVRHLCEASIDGIP